MLFFGRVGNIFIFGVGVFVVVIEAESDFPFDNKDGLFAKWAKWVLFGIEGIMSEDAFMVSEMNFVKIVHVELAYEGGKTVVAVVARKDSLL